ncbi:hypothetical protein DPMN_079265 [Dreissena polymorpha]|uniref:Uncharacterized protein n=1 Tax=Dreissena polymorpha TaxID=45954 RepID=A0A9D4BPW9_DREPO|nr:hypothetical protein DPMN_079265 [Dreissena polymorpha]
MNYFQAVVTTRGTPMRTPRVRRNIKSVTEPPKSAVTAKNEAEKTSPSVDRNSEGGNSGSGTPARKGGKSPVANLSPSEEDKQQLQYQSPGIGHARDRTILSLLDSRSTSDHMATPVSRSLPDGIGQGHRPMPDHLASAIRSLSGDNTGHDMTGTSPGMLITDH